MRRVITVLVGVAGILAYTFDFKWANRDECKEEFPYCLKVEEKVR